MEISEMFPSEDGTRVLNIRKITSLNNNDARSACSFFITMELKSQQD